MFDHRAFMFCDIYYEWNLFDSLLNPELIKMDKGVHYRAKVSVVSRLFLGYNDYFDRPGHRTTVLSVSSTTEVVINS